MEPMQEYERSKTLVESLIAMRAMHVHEGCSQAPLCLGPAGGAALIGHVGEVSAVTVSLLLTSLAMLSDTRDHADDVSRRLLIQRGLTNDAIRAHESAMDRADEAERQIGCLTADVDELRRKLASAEAELTLWEDSADVVGPVALPD